jgi:hypothetical protein
MQVISRLRQALPWLVPSSHVAGGSLLERLRSTSFALCGAATAVGLGLVALAANQGWPGVLDNAIPPIPREGVQSARIAARPPGGDGGASRPGAVSARVSARPISNGSFTATGSPSGPDRHLAVSSPGPGSPVAAPPGGHGGVGAPAGAPSGQQPAAAPQPAPSPAPAPTPVSSPAPTPTEQPPAEESSTGHGKAKGHEKHEGSSAVESPPPVKEKHSHGPPPPPVTPIADPAPPTETEGPAPPGHAKTSMPGQARGHQK